MGRYLLDLFCSKFLGGFTYFNQKSWTTAPRRTVHLGSNISNYYTHKGLVFPAIFDLDCRSPINASEVATILNGLDEFPLGRRGVLGPPLKGILRYGRIWQYFDGHIRLTVPSTRGFDWFDGTDTDTIYTAMVYSPMQLHWLPVAALNPLMSRVARYFNFLLNFYKKIPWS